VTTRSHPAVSLRTPPPARRSIRRLGWRGATVAVPLIGALLVAPPPPRDAPRAAAEADVGGEPPSGLSGRVRATPAAPRVDFNRIAGVLAKRYRVSSRATTELVRTAYHEANRYGLDPLLVLAVMAIESSFNPIAESNMGAVGLMQIIPRFHEDKIAAHEGSVLDPRVNISVGAQLLREYIRRAGSEVAGLQLYNGASDDPANAYAAKVIGERERLRQAIERAGGNRA
jgi:soluble lytic murein transglycosylase-like protein